MDEINFATYTYTNNRLKESVTDANGNRSQYAYDGLARLSHWYFPSKTAVGQYNPSDFEQYGYDSNGNRTSLRKRDGRIISYEYDNLNRVRVDVYPAGTIPNTYYGYDLRNLQLYSRQGSHSGVGISTSYDGFGRATSATTSQSGMLLTLGYEYDLEGNRTRLTHPDGSFFVYGYDGLNRLISISENGSSVPLIAQTYSARGQRELLGRGSSTATAGVTTTSFVFDGIARLESLSQNLAGTTFDDARSFSYNPASQLVSRTFSNSAYIFNQVPSTTTSYKVNGLNQYTELSSGSVVAPAHDANGNMTWDGSSTYAYDILNRLVSVSGSKSSVLSYDARGRLLQTTGGTSGTTQFLYDGDALVAEYASSGALLRRYVHGSGVDEPLVWYEGSSVGSANRRYLHADQQGSIVAVADSTGSGLQANTYDPYGVPSTTNNGRFQYTGQIMLPDLGLYHYKARVYNPGLGRFMQTDPVGYKDDLGLYSYVGDDPMNKTDPTGMIIDVLADVGFIAYDIYKIASGGATSTNMAALGADVAGAFIPGATGLGAAVRAKEGVTITLHAKAGWTSAQRAEAVAKVEHLNQAAKRGELSVVKKPERASESASSRFKKEGNDVPAGKDVDHRTDLQLGGKDSTDNMLPLDSSVNRSLGIQVHHQIKDLPAGTKVCSVVLKGCK